MKNYLFGIICVLILSACASKTADVQYYHLPAPAAVQQDALGGGKYILVAQVQVAEYLAGSGIVYQLSSVEYKTAQNNRWAESLSSQLQNSLADELRSRLPDRMILTRRHAAPEATVSVQITGFHGRYGGQALVSGEWMILGRKGVVMQKNFEHLVDQEADGYKALVEALYLAWQAEAARIAEAVESLPGPK